MNNEIKFKLMTRFPRLFKKELKDLAADYREEKLGFGRESARSLYKSGPFSEPEEKDPVREYTLVDIIASCFDEKFMDYMKRYHGVIFTINDHTPDGLLHNPRFLDYIARENPALVQYFPDEMITDEHIRLLENAKYFYVSHHGFPKKLRNSRKYLDLVIDAIKKDDSNFSKEGYITHLLDLVSGDLELENYVLDNLEEEIKAIADFSNNPYERVSGPILENERFIEICINKSALVYDLVPDSKKEFAKIVLLRAIENDEFNAYSISFIRTEGNSVFKDKDIFLSLVRNRIKKEYEKRNIPLPEGELLLNNELKITEDQHLDRYFANANIDEMNLTNEEKYAILKIALEIKDAYNHHPKIVYEMRKNQEFLSYLIDRSGLSAITDLNVSTFSPKVVAKIIDKLSDEENNVYIELKPYYEKNKDDPSLFRYLLEKSRDSRKFASYFFPIIDAFDTKLLTKENLELINEIINTHKNNVSLTTLLKVVSNSNTIMSDWLDVNGASNIELFSQKAIDPLNAKKLMLKLPLSKGMNFIMDAIVLEDSLVFSDNKDFDVLLEKAIEENNVFMMLLLYSEHNKGNFESELFKENKELLDNIIRNDQERRGIPRSIVDRILNNEIRATNYRFCFNDESKYFIENIGQITSQEGAEFLRNYPIAVLEKINKKQLNTIIDYLRIHDVPNDQILQIGMNMYLTIGFNRSKDLLNPQEGKNYGPISAEYLKILFLNMNTTETLFKQEGKGYTPILNEQLLNMIFGESYKVANTPMRNALNGFADKEREVVLQKERILNDLTLTQEEKDAKIKELDKKKASYSNEVKTFLQELSSVFSNWDVILEEFAKAKHKSKLELKLNIEEINKIIKTMNNKKKTPELEVRDEPLLKTDIFEYVGYDLQYTANPSLAPKRAIELSRMMENNKDKKFPNVTLSRGKLSLTTYAPDDRDILTAGYKSKCCFRPNGNADNSGKDFSLLHYCCTNEYGGGIKICDDKGKVVMFSPILRNGNVLMIHSIETTGMTPEESIEVHELLREYAQKVIESAKDKGDDISFVTITDLHYLNPDYVTEQLDDDKKFHIYDPDGSHAGMYNNLTSNHKVLAVREGKTQKDIKYDTPIEISYESPRQSVVKSISINEDEEKSIERVTLLKQKYMALANARHDLLQEGKKEEAYPYVEELHEIKQEIIRESNSLYKNKEADVYNDYQRAKVVMERIAKEKGTEVPESFRRCIFGPDWYIAITRDGKIIGDTTEKGVEDYTKYMAEARKELPDYEVYPAGIKKEVEKKEKNTTAEETAEAAAGKKM